MTLSFDPDKLDLPIGHYIGGKLIAAEGVIAMQRPSDGESAGFCPRADAGIVDQAVENAHMALKSSGWGAVSPRERTRAMQAWADLIEADIAVLGPLEAAPSTRLISQVPSFDIGITAEQIRFFAELADKECGALAPTHEGALGMIMDEPIGVIGAITPWNFPITMAGWKLGPALAAGNAVVLKPSEMTPWSTIRLAELAIKAGIPAGIINIVLGDGPVTGNALTGHPGIGKVSFTGSTAAGQAIMGNVAQTGIKPVTLELGGKSPQIVFADADLALAARCIAGSILFNAGQACVAGSRVLVEESLAPALADALIAHFTAVKPVRTWQEGGDFSPVISARQIARMDGITAAAKAEGAEVLTGGAQMDRPGFYYQPTILAGIAQDSPAVTEEIFGPVLTFQTFRDEAEALRMADHPTYGLCAGIYTKDLSRAIRMTRAIETGTVWVNRYGRSRDHVLPTGGYKSSGIGKDLGREAYHANRRSKSVLIDL